MHSLNTINANDRTMKKLFVVFFSLLLAAVSRAQDLQNMTFFIWPRTDQLFVGSCCLDVPVETVDSTRLTVFYVMHGRTANEVYGQTLYRLQCGAHVTRFSSRAQYYANLLYTERRHGKELAGDETTKAEEAGSQLLVAPSEVWRDLTSEQLEVCYQIPFQDGRVYRYDESVPSFSWRMTELRDSVSGYDCFCAETHYAGRDWKVWFTPDLPLSAGPWKFSGLPGVILRAEDREGDYRFECCGISRGSEPIRRYLWPEYRGTRTKRLLFERQAHESPLHTFGQGGRVRFFRSGSESGPPEELDDSWTIPYNPLERE